MPKKILIFDGGSLTVLDSEFLNQIEVVLPAYNGAKFLEAQVESIHGQSLRPQRLIVRDDGSMDNTIEVLSSLQERYGSWLMVMHIDAHLGILSSMNQLLLASNAPYIAMADQDDVWHVDKLERSMKLMHQLEARYGCSMPLLTHSDLDLVDQWGAKLGVTYLQRQHLDPRLCAPAELALTNVVTGATVLMNRALLNKALPIPQAAVMHDWWLALVASVFGIIAMLDHPTVNYRQHGGNLLGATGLGWNYWVERLRRLIAHPETGDSFLRVVRQVEVFENTFDQRLSELPHLVCLPRIHRISRILMLNAGDRPRLHGRLRALAFYTQLLLSHPYSK